MISRRYPDRPLNVFVANSMDPDQTALLLNSHGSLEV